MKRQPHTFHSLTSCEVVMVEMVCQEEMVWMGSQDLKGNRDHVDLKEIKDFQDLGVLEWPTLGGERAPALIPLERNYSMLGELVGVPSTIKEEEQRRFVCLLILTTSMLLDQPVQPSFLLYMEQNIKLAMAHITICLTKMFPVLSAMLPPELQWSWFLLKLSAHLPGPGSTMATSWHKQATGMINDILHLNVLTRTKIQYQEVKQILLVLSFMKSRPTAMVYPALLTTTTRSWTVWCAPSDRENVAVVLYKLFSTVYHIAGNIGSQKIWLFGLQDATYTYIVTYTL